MEIMIPETIREKVERRDEQAKIMQQILELAQKLTVQTYPLSEKVRYPAYIREDDITDLRKKIDIEFWREIFKETQIEKYMTSKDKEKILEKFEDETPIFDMENVTATVTGLIGSEEALATNIIKKVYESITDAVFRLGNKHNNKSEKRLQLNIPKTFRLSVLCSNKELPSYIPHSPYSSFYMIEDLERACYLCDDKIQPDYNNSIRSLTDDQLRKGNDTSENPYFTLKLYKNGNMKISFKNNKVLGKLNKWGRKGNRIES